MCPSRQLGQKKENSLFHEKRIHIFDCEARFRNYLPLDTSIFLQNCQQDSIHVRIQKPFSFAESPLSTEKKKKAFFPFFNSWLLDLHSTTNCRTFVPLALFFVIMTWVQRPEISGRNPVTSPSSKLQILKQQLREPEKVTASRRHFRKVKLKFVSKHHQFTNSQLNF